MNDLDVRALVKRMGGPTHLHKRLKKEGYDISLQAINMWVYRNSLPAKWLATLGTLAAKDRRPLKWQDLPRKAKTDEELQFLE